MLVSEVLGCFYSILWSPQFTKTTSTIGHQLLLSDCIGIRRYLLPFLPNSHPKPSWSGPCSDRPIMCKFNDYLQQQHQRGLLIRMWVLREMPKRDYECRVVSESPGHQWIPLLAPEECYCGKQIDPVEEKNESGFANGSIPTSRRKSNARTDEGADESASCPLSDDPQKTQNAITMWPCWRWHLDGIMKQILIRNCLRRWDPLQDTD